MAYSFMLKASAEKALGKLPKAIQLRLIEKAAALAEAPRPLGSMTTRRGP